jgi:hypothetical protein
MSDNTRAVAGLAELLIGNRSFARADSMLDGAPEKDSMKSSLLKLRVKAAYNSKQYVDATGSGGPGGRRGSDGAACLSLATKTRNQATGGKWHGLTFAV